MGMYTTIIGKDGVDWQIKTGEDDLERFTEGEELPWRYEKDEPGKGYLLDGIYVGIASCPKNKHEFMEAWVVIKDHKVVEIVSRVEDTGGRLPPDKSQYDALEDRYNTEAQLHELWNAGQWAVKEEWDRIRQEKREEEFQTWCKEMDHDPKAPGTSMAYYFHEIMKRKSFAREILVPVASKIASGVARNHGLPDMPLIVVKHEDNPSPLMKNLGILVQKFADMPVPNTKK